MSRPTGRGPQTLAAPARCVARLDAKVAMLACAAETKRAHASFRFVFSFFFPSLKTSFIQGTFLTRLYWEKAKGQGEREIRV